MPSGKQPPPRAPGPPATGARASSRPGAPPLFRGHPRHDPGSATSSELIGALFARLGNGEPARKARILGAWAEVVGEVFRRKTHPESLRGTTLIVRVESSPLAHELTLLKGEILTRLAANLGPGVVTDFRTRVGALPG